MARKRRPVQQQRRVMARGKKTGGRDFKKGQGGRKKGAKDRVPRLRSLKGNLKAVLEDIAKTEEPLVRASIVRGIRAAAPKSFQYLQFLAHYVIGKPAETIKFRPDLSKYTEEELAELERLIAKGSSG